MDMIPNLCITVTNRYDLLEKLFDSIDYPIKEICLLLNSNKDRDDDILNRLKCKFIQLKIFDPGYNFGLSSSWNSFIKKYVNIDGIVYITQDDIEFKPNALKDFYNITNSLIHDDVILGFSWGMFAIRKTSIEKLGYFDENFYPIYYEDADYCRRSHLHNMYKENKFKFGYGDRNQFIHFGGATSFKKSKVELIEYQRMIGMNATYYIKKWGGSQGNETYNTPFNISELTYKDWIDNDDRHQNVCKSYNI